MHTALVLMTILGCDDTATQCHYVDTVDRQWQSVQQCDSVSERYLDRFDNVDYPVVVAVCETAAPEMQPGDGTKDQAVLAEADGGESYPVPKEDLTGEAEKPVDGTAGSMAIAEPTLSGRVRATIARVVPDMDGLKSLAAKPVHVVTDTYAWVAKRLDPRD